MKISPYAVKLLVPFITGDEHPPKRSGPDLVKLFNGYGIRDIYDWNNGGLPDVYKRNGNRPSRSQYVEARLNELSGKPELRQLLIQVVNELNDSEDAIGELNNILHPEHYTVIKQGGQWIVEGGVIDKSEPVVNESHFQEIQNRILKALDEAKLSIWVVMAWFTNETLFQKLVDKHKQGIDVRLAIYDDGVNRKHGVDFSQLPLTLIKKGKGGGLMHNKFCVVDNQVLITGSYNWTNNAETRNDENVLVARDPARATDYSIEFNRLTKS